METTYRITSMNSEKTPDVILSIPFPSDASPSLQLIHVLDGAMNSMTRDGQMEEDDINAALAWFRTKWMKDYMP